MNIRQQVDKDLKDSGLFESSFACSACYCVENESELGKECLMCFEGEIIDLGSLQSADTAESILAEMGVHVVWFEDDWHLTTIKRASILVVMLDGGHYIGKIPKGQRTLANNAALAWLSKQAELSQKLKVSVELVRNK